MLFTSFLFMLVGGAALAAACYIPHKERFSSDHTVGTMLCGILFALGCFGISVYCLTH